MAERKIIWAPSALKELINILEFYNERNESNIYSSKLLCELKSYLKTLSIHPFIGRPTSDFKTRVLVFKDYLIFYQNRIDQIEIVSFWDNRQNEQNKKH
jgi:toxin YoeB